MGSELATVGKEENTILSSDWGVQRDAMKVESIGIADQDEGGNTFPGLVDTARHTTKGEGRRSRWANPQGREGAKVGGVKGGK